MPPLLSVVVSDIVSRYPDISSGEIVDELVNLIQANILPEAVRMMKLPPPPSQIRIALEKKREARHKKKYRYAYLEKKMTLNQNLEYVKYHLAESETGYPSLSTGLAFGDFNSAVIPNASLLDSSFAHVNIEKNDGLPLSKDVGFSRFNKKPEKEKSNLYMKSESVSPINTEFRIDETIQAKIFTDPLYLTVSSAIEIFLRDFAKRYPDANFSLSLKIDAEIATWEKIIVRLAIPNLSIDQKMSLWDDIDKNLRLILHSMVPADDAKQQAEIEVLSKKIFTRMDL